MRKLFLSTLFYALILFQTGFSQLYTYASNSIDLRWAYTDSTGQDHYDTIVQIVNTGDIYLKSSSIDIKPHGSYLDITETATMTISAKDNSLSYYIGGTISVPKKSTISSLYLTDGKKEYSAKILAAFSNNHIDTALGDAVAVLRLANRAGASYPLDQYSFQLYNSTPATEYTVKIRYLCPITGNVNSPNTINLLCRSNSKNPGKIEINYFIDKNETSYSLRSNELKYQLTDGMSLQLPFQNQIQIIPTNQTSTQFHTTDFAEGSWKGKYLLLNTSIPDSIKGLLGKPIETIVLWRWNKPNSFVTKYNYGNGQENRYLSNYGYQATTQSKAIKDLTIELSKTGNRTGLVHSIPNKAQSVFPLCKNGSTAYAKLESYLDQFTSDYFLNSTYYESDIQPDNPKDSLVDSSKNEFLNSMKIVKGLYSNGQGIMKHLIILSCGPVPITRDLVSLEELDSLFTDVSVDKDNAVWRDINFPIIGNIALNRTFISVGDFKMPEYKPTSILLKVSTSSKDYTFPLSPQQPSFSIIAKSDNAWNPQLTWSGYDASGSLISTATSTAIAYNAINDTGLVKLWAFNDERLSETKETDLGYKYGVISEDNYMKIYPTFKGYDSTATEFATSMNYYSKTPDYDDPYNPSAIKSQLLSNVKNFRCTYRAGLLYITLPANKLIKRIQLYSLSGKLIADFDPAQFRTSFGYNINLSSIHKSSRNATGIILVRIDGEDYKMAQKILVK